MIPGLDLSGGAGGLDLSDDTRLSTDFDTNINFDAGGVSLGGNDMPIWVWIGLAVVAYVLLK